MNNLFFPDKSKSGLEQAKIIAIDRAKGRISIALRTGLVTTAAYLYDISDLRVGLNVVVGRVSGGYVIMNQVVVSDKVKLSYGRGGIISPINIPPVTDILGPSLIITSHVNNQIVGTSTITISGTASDSGYGNHGISQVTINGERADNDTALGKNIVSWSKTIILTSETTVFTIIAYDNFSVPNTTTKIITIITTADVVPPELPFTWNDAFSGPAIDTEKWLLSDPPPSIVDGKFEGYLYREEGSGLWGSSGCSSYALLGEEFSLSIKVAIQPGNNPSVCGAGFLLNSGPLNLVSFMFGTAWITWAHESDVEYVANFVNTEGWLKIVRNGTSFSFFTSFDGLDWGIPIVRTLWSGLVTVSLWLNSYNTESGTIEDFIFESGEPSETPKASSSSLYWYNPS